MNSLVLALTVLVAIGGVCSAADVGLPDLLGLGLGVLSGGLGKGLGLDGGLDKGLGLDGGLGKGIGLDGGLDGGLGNGLGLGGGLDAGLGGGLGKGLGLGGGLGINKAIPIPEVYLRFGKTFGPAGLGASFGKDVDLGFTRFGVDKSLGLPVPHLGVYKGFNTGIGSGIVYG